jgi:polar amino acid transport system substrate-binding protein
MNLMTSLVSLAFRVFPALMAVSALTLTAHAHAQDLLDRVKERGKLVVGVKNDYQPFGWLDKDGKLKGFEIDLAKSVARQILGTETAIEFVPVVAANRIELLNAGRVDVLFATLGFNADRAKVLDFTDQYYMMDGLVLLTPNNTTITKWEDLQGKKACGMQGNLYNRTLATKFGADLVLFTGTAEMFKAFRSSRCETIAFDGPILQQKVVEDGWRGDYKIALNGLEYIPIAGGVKKGETRFLDAVNKAIVAAEGAGVLTSAEKNYNLGESKYVVERAAKAKR